MRTTRRKVLTFVLVVSLALGMILPAQTAQAASAEMKKAKVNWDLKPNNLLTYQTYYTGIGMTEQTVKMTSYKVKNSKKKGYKECRFTLRYQAHGFTPEEVHACGNAALADGSIGGEVGFAVVDYETGIFLGMSKKSRDITLESPDGWTISDEHKYQDEHGCWVRVYDYKITVTVTYPENYKNLCIGVYGSTKATKTLNNIKFGNGKASFAKTSYCGKTNKSVAHFMRVK